MPKSFLHFRRPLPAGSAIFIALFASLLLSACFNATGEESPYTVPAGLEVDQVQLETAPDGSILMMVRVAMYYRHADPQTPWDTTPMIRNYHSILYRRLNGVWNVTPFKNVQDYNSIFPVLIPVTGSGFQAFVRDGATIRRYALREGAWLPQPNPTMPLGMHNFWQGDSRNWERFSNLAMPNDSVIIPIDQKWNANGNGLLIEVREPGGRSIRLDGTFTPLAFHAADRYRGLVGVEYQVVGEVEDGVRNSILVHYFWKPGDSTAHRNVLSENYMTPDAFFGNYKGGTALFLGNSSSYQIFPLDSDGSSNGSPIHSHTDTVPMLSPIFAADSNGCFHSLTTNYYSAIPDDRFIHHNTCVEGPGDTLLLPPVATGLTGSTTSIRLRIGPQGNPIVAFIRRESLVDDDRMIRQVASRLFFAELREGRWVLESVDIR